MVLHFLVLNTITSLLPLLKRKRKRDGRVMKIKWEEKRTESRLLMSVVFCYAEIFVSVWIVISCLHRSVE